MIPWRIFRIPLLLALLSGAGLVAALLTDGPADLAWSLLAAVPLAVIAVKWLAALRGRP